MFRETTDVYRYFMEKPSNTNYTPEVQQLPIGLENWIETKK
jgi:hypothetical protein